MPAGRTKPPVESANNDSTLDFHSARSMFESRSPPTPSRSGASQGPVRTPSGGSVDADSSGLRSRVGELKRLFQSGQPIPAEELTYCASLDSPLLARKRLMVVSGAGGSSTDIDVEPEEPKESTVRLRQAEDTSSVQSRRAMFEPHRLSAGATPSPSTRNRNASSDSTEQNQRGPETTFESLLDLYPDDRMAPIHPMPRKGSLPNEPHKLDIRRPSLPDPRMKRDLDQVKSQSAHDLSRPFSRGQLHDMPLIKQMRRAAPEPAPVVRVRPQPVPLPPRPRIEPTAPAKNSWSTSRPSERDDSFDVEEMKTKVENATRRIFGSDSDEEEDEDMITLDLTNSDRNKKEIQKFLDDTSESDKSAEEDQGEDDDGGVILISRKDHVEDSLRDSGLHPIPPDEALGDLPMLSSQGEDEEESETEGNFNINVGDRYSDYNRSCSPDSLSDHHAEADIDDDDDDGEDTLEEEEEVTPRSLLRRSLMEEEEEVEKPRSLLRRSLMEEEEEESHRGHLHRSVIEDEGLVIEWRVDDRRPAVQKLQEIGCVDGIHYLEDGNFFYEREMGEPEEKEDEEGREKKASRVRFTDDAVLVYSTFTSDDYERGNDSIDPLGAAAEYELEKRLERMDRLDVDLNRGTSGLGISIVGLGAGQPSGVEKLGIFVKGITPGGAADKDGRMKVCDQIVEVDGQSLVGVSQSFAGQVLRNTRGLVHFVLGRERDPATSDIVRLVDQVSQRTGQRAPAPPPPPPPPPPLPPVLGDPDELDLPPEEDTDEERGLSTLTTMNGSVMTDSKIDRLVSEVDAETHELDKRRRNGRMASLSSSSDDGEYPGSLPVVAARPDRAEELSKRLEEAEATNDRLKKEVQEAQTRMDIVQAREQLLREKLQLSEARLERQEGELEALRVRAQDDEVDGAPLVQELRRELEESRQAEETLRVERDELSSRLTAMDERYAVLVAELRERVSALEAELSGTAAVLPASASLERIAVSPTADRVISIEPSGLAAQPSQWSVDDVVRLMKTLELHHLEQVVRMMAIDGATLLKLDGQTMKEKGIHNSSDRTILKRRIKELVKAEEMKSPAAGKSKKSRFPFGK